MLLTIFTPTYNRAHLIQRTFESLRKQSFKDFEWLVVDDGSTDNTEQIIKLFQKKAEFSIIYIKKANGGKHTAYNLAIKEANGEFFFIVDSDDWLPENGLEIIKDQLLSLYDKNDVIGILGLKAYPSHKIIGIPFKKNMQVTTWRNLELEGGVGERSSIFKTSILSQNTLPVLEGERFMTEGVIYNNILNCPIKVINQVFTICEYQDGGLSSNPRRLLINNPGGFKLFYRHRIDMRQSISERFGNILRYNLSKRLYKGNQVPDYSGRYALLVSVLDFITPLVANRYLRKASK